MIRRQALIVFAFTVLGLLAFQILLSNTVLLGSYRQLELQAARTNALRTQESIGQQIRNLDDFLYSWSSWTDMAKWIVDGNKAFYDDTWGAESFVPLNFRNAIAFDRECKPKFASRYSDRNDITFPVQKELIPKLLPHCSYFKTKEKNPEKQSLSGLIRVNDEMLYYSWRPILKTDNSGPIQGSLFFAKPLDRKTLERISLNLKMEIGLYDLNKPIKDKNLFYVLKNLPITEVYLKQINDQEAIVYSPLIDLSPEPTMMLRIKTNRTVMALARDTLTKTGFILGFSTLFLVGIGLLILEWRILRRISRLNLEVGKITQTGSHEDRVEIEGNDELSDLGKNINSMLQSLEEGKTQLQHNRDELHQKSEELKTVFDRQNQEIRSAYMVQKGTSPPQSILYRNCRISSWIKPASLLSGDFFEVIPHQDQVAILHCDVSGHGASSAMVTIALKMLFARTVAETQGETLSPLKILTRLDQAMSGSMPPDLHFATAFCAVFNTKQMELSFSRAGHPQPILIDENGVFVEAKNRGIPPVNLISALNLPPGPTDETTIKIQPGWRLFSHSDGIVEVFNEEGEEFGVEKLLQEISKAPHASASNLFQSIETTINQWNAWSHDPDRMDDQSMLIIEFLGE